MLVTERATAGERSELALKPCGRRVAPAADPRRHPPFGLAIGRGHPDRRLLGGRGRPELSDALGGHLSNRLGARGRHLVAALPWAGDLRLRFAEGVGGALANRRLRAGALKLLREA